MSTGKTDTTKKRSLLVRNIMSCGITFAVLAAVVIFSVSLVTRADELQPDGENVASSTDAPGSNGIVKGEDGSFNYYVNGVLYTSPGWYSAEAEDVYIGTDGHVLMSYDRTGRMLSVYHDGAKTASGKTVQILADGYAYAFDENGVQVSVQGWYSVDDNNRYEIDDQSRAVRYYSRNDSIIRMYSFSAEAAQWVSYTSTWQSMDDMSYYFNVTGVCTKVYDSSTNKASVLNGDRKLVPAKKQLLILDDGNTYFFDGSGSRVSASGWYVTSGNGSAYVSGNGVVTSKIYKSGAVYRMYSYRSSDNSWNPVKNVWKKAEQRLFYFNSTGAGTVLYDSGSKVLYKYSTKYRSYRRASNTIDKLNGTRYYFYNKNGVRVTSSGWKNSGKGTLYYVNRYGYVTSRYTDTKGSKRMYDYNYSKKKWEQKKKLWRDVGDNKYYFGSAGVAAVSYNTKSQKAYVYKKNKWTVVKQSIQKIGSSNFYFNKNGKRVTKAGVYKTADGYLAYVNGRGVVYKREYDLSVKRYYTIDLGHGKTTKVYGYYELADAKSLMNLVNQHRIDNGLAPLTISTSLTETATTRAKEISNRYSHYRPNGTLCINSMYELYGENLACGFSEEDLVFRAWSKSYSHDSNMLNTTYKTMGAAVFVALDKDKEGFRRYYVLTFGK